MRSEPRLIDHLREPPQLSLRFIAVWLRNLRVWRKLMLPSILGNFGEPLLYLLALGYGLGQFVGEVEDMRYMVFLASGIVCSAAMTGATFEALYSAYTRLTMQQTWAAMLAAPMNVDDVVLGEIAWAATKALINASAIVLVAALLGLVSGPEAILVLPVILLAGLAFAGIAMIVTAISPSYDFFLYYFTLVMTPMLLLSGVFFPLTSLPDAVQIGAQFLPLAHVVMMVRPLMTGGTIDAPILHLGVVIGYIVATYWISAALARRRLIK
ncbi:ABC-type multidrug transport system, permease component [Spiribacter salinus M19-40]|jgi:lipooligosaccharide transport system permease protein|uniref:Transport permease protein n=1 Tax=Spiribacter salinus M19-40 TaxID=1260251 RepID=R4VMP7_9GAMM|nr:ABC transporter permease [Spiribacter salinus]AGM41702.1 ABC-type multidrug transport system, permease component [Spiribacter salinus M19-40]MBY5268747.1 nodulation protein NodJ [Spiribacter salinus]MDR9413566.1 ABC transporter permease [Spiribacter sp.]MDR9455368.1 ABC transporter permease [Spiribacter sp.]